MMIGLFQRAPILIFIFCMLFSPLVGHHLIIVGGVYTCILKSFVVLCFLLRREPILNYMGFFSMCLGLLDNVLSDYLWAKAVLLTTATVATAGLSIQVPLAAIVDSVTGHAPHFADYLGAVAVMIGFVGINIPSDAFKRSKEATLELENGSNRITSSTSEAAGGSSGSPDSAAPS